jgi:hypothetical protein
VLPTQKKKKNLRKGLSSLTNHLHIHIRKTSKGSFLLGRPVFKP